jgi:hypothetical protein
MRREFERALDECLSQLNTGELGLEEVLARYPEHEAELRPLLRTAMLVRQVPQAVPSPEAKAAGRQRLLSAVARKRREKAQARPGLVHRLERSAAILVQPLVQPQRQSLRLAQAIAALLIIVSLVSAGTLRVAAGSLPDSPLYPIKRATEWVQLALTTSPAGKARLHMSYSERRSDENLALLETGKGLSEATLQDMKSANSAALTAIGQAPEEEKDSLLTGLLRLTKEERKALEAIKAQVPPSDQEVVEEALQASEDHQEIATRAMVEPDILLTPSPRPTDTAAPVAPGLPAAPAPTPTRAPTFTPIPVPTATPVPPTVTPIPKPTAKPTATPVLPMATPVPAPTETPVPTPQVEVPRQPTPEPPATPTPQVEIPSQPPEEPTVEPSPTLTATPSPMPTSTPTSTPPVTPTSTPPATPTPVPTEEPTATPTPQVEIPSQPVPDSSITNCRVSDAPKGAAVGKFPSGTRKVYIVFDYAYMAGEEVEIRVYDSVGNVLFDKVKTLSGSDTESIGFSVGGGGLAAGRYLVTIYKNQVVIGNITWDVAEPGG